MSLKLKGLFVESQEVIDRQGLIHSTHRQCAIERAPAVTTCLEVEPAGPANSKYYDQTQHLVENKEVSFGNPGSNGKISC
jgi:hypothetical protein